MRTQFCRKKLNFIIKQFAALSVEPNPSTFVSNKTQSVIFVVKYSNYSEYCNLYFKKSKIKLLIFIFAYFLVIKALVFNQLRDLGKPIGFSNKYIMNFFFKRSDISKYYKLNNKTKLAKLHFKNIISFERKCFFFKQKFVLN